jgi:hypothetical protein
MDPELILLYNMADFVVVSLGITNEEATSCFEIERVFEALD